MSGPGVRPRSSARPESPRDVALRRAVRLAVEELGLLLAGGELPPHRERGPLDRGAVVRFAGAVHGRLVLETTAAVAAAVTENILGGDSRFPAALERDALGELANVICGNVLPALGLADDPVALAPPRASAARDAEPLAGERLHAAAEVEIEGGWASARLFLVDPDTAR